MAALTFHVGYLEATRDYLPANWDILWSLSVEEMFYLFFPLVARVLRKRWLLAVLLSLFLAAGPFARMKAFNPNEVWREYSYLGGMDGIAFGCLTAMWLAGRRLSRVWAYGLAGAAIVVFCLGDSLQGYKLGLGRTGLFFSLFAVGVSLVIAAASQSGWKTPRVLAPLLMLGQRSYEIYLTHMFVVLGLFALFVRWGTPLRDVPLLFVAVIVCAGVLGWGVAVLYAEPANRWIRKGERGLGVALPQVD